MHLKMMISHCPPVFNQIMPNRIAVNFFRPRFYTKIRYLISNLFYKSFTHKTLLSQHFVCEAKSNKFCFESPRQLNGCVKVHSSSHLFFTSLHHNFRLKIRTSPSCFALIKSTTWGSEMTNQEGEVWRFTKKMKKADCKCELIESNSLRNWPERESGSRFESLSLLNWSLDISSRLRAWTK